MADLIIVDWDGVCVDSQRAKESSWLLTALYAQGRLSKALFDSLRRGDAIGQACSVMESHPAEMGQVRRLAGQSRKDTAAQVCNLFHLDGTPQQLAETRNMIRQPLLDSPMLCAPVAGALDFLRLVHEAGLPIAVVTQTTTPDVNHQIAQHHIPNVFACIECAGDPGYGPCGSSDVKTAAYENACRRLGTEPHNAMACEDSLSGVRSARRAGTYVIALTAARAERIEEADLNVHPDLGALARRDVIAVLAAQSPEQCGAAIRRFLGPHAS